MSQDAYPEPAGFPPYEPRPDESRPNEQGLTPRPDAGAPRPAAPGHLAGRATGCQVRTEGGGYHSRAETVLGFRLADGDHVREVELRGLQLSGTVRDGDWVEVADPQGHGTVWARTVENLTTGSVVSAGISAHPAVRIGMIVFIVIFALFALGVGLFIAHGFAAFNGP